MKYITMYHPLVAALVFGLLSEGAAWCTAKIPLRRNHGRTFLAYSRASQQLSASRASSAGFSRNQPKGDADLSDLAQSMLDGSDLIYPFATLREAVKNAMVDGTLSELDRPELIRPELKGINRYNWKKGLDSALRSPMRAADSTITFNVDRAIHRYLESEIPIVNILDFVINNKDFVCRISEGEFEFEKMKKTLEQYRKVSLGIVEFDDEFHKSQLVFGISVNRTNKRLTVCFRSSVDDNEDWNQNFKVLHTPLAINPTELNGSYDKIKVHSGYSGYLNDALIAEGNATKKKYSPLREFSFAAAKEFDVLQDLELFKDAERTTKFDKIVANIGDLYKSFPDYELFVCGHSLGGALSQLLAFQLASGGHLDEHAKSITAITFASPRVGNREFKKAFQELEERYIIRHLRVSNEGDIVPAIPPVGYTQTGVHVHGHKDLSKPLEVGYRLVKSFFSQVGAGWKINVFKVKKSFEKHHSLDEHKKRLFNPNEANEAILKKTIEAWYTDYEDKIKKRT